MLQFTDEAYRKSLKASQDSGYFYALSDVSDWLAQEAVKLSPNHPARAVLQKASVEVLKMRPPALLKKAKP